MSFDWWTFGLQLVNFLVLVWLLHRFLYKPVRAVMKQREERAGQALAEAEAGRKEASAEKAKYASDIAAFDQQQADLVAKAREDATKQAAIIAETAQKKADALIAEAKEAAQRERRQGEAAMQNDITDLAVDLAKSILTQTGPGGLDAVFRQRIMAELDARPEADRAEMKSDAASPDAEVKVITAEELPDDEKAAWTAALKDKLALAGGPVFAVDSSIVGGAELRLPHAAIRFAWADQVQQAAALLKQDLDGQAKS